MPHVRAYDRRRPPPHGPCQRRGAPICTRTNVALENGLDQQRLFRDEGADLGRTVIGHSDDSDDVGYLEQIIDNGSYCGMDRIGIQRTRTSAERADMVASLVERGYADRITLSHDSCCRMDLAAEDMSEAMPTWRLTHITQDVIPMLRERGVSDDDIDQMTLRNPRSIFERNERY